MKTKRIGFLVILAFAALASSCGTSYYVSTSYQDGIYYRPSAESRAQTIAAQEAKREKARQRQYEQYLAKDEEGNLYVVTELLDGETYESRLHKFDSPWYVNNVWYNGWDTRWYNPWWYSYPYGYNSWTMGYAWLDSYYGFGYPYYYGRYNPYYYNWRYYDPWYFAAGSAGWYAWNRWGHNHWYDYPYGYAPGPGPRPTGRGHQTVYTPRTSGSGMYHTSRSTSGSRGMYSTRRSNSGGSVSTRTSSGAVRTSGGNRPVRTGASGGSYKSSGSSSGSGSYSRSSGSYSGSSGGGGGYSGGSSGSGSGGGSHTSSGGSHSGGGRR